ncbi:MAG: 4-hydroxythreonine-4-phosphate dehydrogenase PdxA [Bacteroidia bacterium]
MNDKIKVGISIGDINGIGMEIILKTFADKNAHFDFIPVVYGSSKVASFYRKALEITDFSFHLVKDALQINPKNANLVACWDEEVEINVGQLTPLGGKYALKSLNSAIADAKAGKIDVLVTAPLNKQNIQNDNFNFPGHTEYLAQQFGVQDNLMILCSENLKVALVTGHIPLSKVASTINTELIIKKARILNKSLKEDFGIRKPKIAVLGLNPHAGDNGVLGNEEKEIILPAIEKLRNEDILAIGPYAADGFFGAGTFAKFDAILAMYHDQGLAPFKAISFGSGVNYTAGMPIIRTSPDHGTGFDIAGKNMANPDSFRAAIYLACDIYKNRLLHKEINANPLEIKELKREK